MFDAASATSSASSPPKPLLYNTMLRGYLTLGLPREEAALFRDMPSHCAPYRHTFHLAAAACTRASPEEAELGRRIESAAAARGFTSDLLVTTAPIGMHAKAGDMGAARRMFDGMPMLDAVAWNAVMVGTPARGS
ncbi:pentatricopeptide repeat-containing protein At2g39620-like [Phragmites australis]|uniref:pentatricopeptide repeat-containing protein At2g39620-like n=1 Tax=Phragmites australis TaxID=29695 RepID=UPI002D796E31|nr:pentatricopeptide repeat-containing protein At2g39620-like [Phragmites australis]